MSKYKCAYQIDSWQEDELLPLLEELADLGIHGVEARELCEQSGLPFETIRDCFHRNSMSLVALTGGGDFVIPEYREEIIHQNIEIAALLKKFGAHHLVIETGRRELVENKKKDFAVAAETLNELGKQCMDYDIHACILPQLGQRIETEEDIDRIMNLVDTRDVFLCPDSGHLAAAEENPRHIFKTYGSCIRHVHFQDANPETNEKEKAPIFCALGEGKVDFPALIEILDDIQYHDWITVTLDEVEDRKESGKRSIRYLHRLLANQCK